MLLSHRGLRNRGHFIKNVETKGRAASDKEDQLKPAYSRPAIPKKHTEYHPSLTHQLPNADTLVWLLETPPSLSDQFDTRKYHLVYGTSEDKPSFPGSVLARQISII